MFNMKTKEEHHHIATEMLAQWRISKSKAVYKEASSSYARYLQLIVDDGSIDKNPNSQMTNTEKEALDVFIPLCEATIHHKEHLFSEQVDNIMCFLHKPACVDYIVSSGIGDKILSWYTCYIGTNYVFNNFTFTEGGQNTKAKLPVLLENWTGKPFEANVPDLEHVVKHLFGNTYWDLLGSPSEAIVNYAEMYSIMYSILDLNPPFVFRSENAEKAEVNISLPNNISS